MRQAALAIDYLVWMPLATAVSLFVTMFAYGFLVTVIDPFTRGAAIVLTSALLVAWPVWIVVLAWNLGNGVTRPLRLVAGLAFAVPTTVVLAVFLNFVNACNTGEGFPLGGSSLCL
jgi:hypothetical protein